MVKKLGITLLITLSVLGLTAFATADGVTRRVKFAKGKSSVTLSNAVIRGELDTYILGARAGQQMMVKVAALENNAAFQIQGPGGNYLEGAGEMDDATSLTVTIPRNGDYRIIVGGTHGNASYKLTVSIR